MPQATQDNLICILNPATGKKLTEIKPSTEQEVKEKILKANDAFPLWSSLTIEKRVQYLTKIYNRIIDDRDKITKTITENNGKPLCESYLTEIASTLQIMEYFIKNGKNLLSNKNISLGPLYPTKKSFMSYEPFGVFGIIEPWNYPFYLPMSAITKTLICGNTFIFKPSSTVSLIGKMIEDILIKADLPDGVCNVVYGNSQVADYIISGKVDKIIFTGSVDIGKKILETCGKRLLPVCLELGGKDPAIVLKSTNLDYAAGGVLWGSLSNCGQACASTERVYVQSEIYDEFIEKITNLAKNLKIGNGLDDDIDIGPLINIEQVNKIEEHISDAISKGAKLHTGGKRLDKEGFYFEPTVLSNVNHSMKVMTEETFGPVIPIMRFESSEEALELANDTCYGLSASIWTGETKDIDKLTKNLNCGTVWVNDSLFQQAHPACPWTGYKNSGYGSATIYDFTRSKHISIDKGFIPTIHPKNVWWFPYKGKAKSYSDLIELIYKLGVKEKAKAAFDTLVNFLR